MSNCNECLYDKDGICQNDECSFDLEGSCLEFESRKTYDSGYQQGRADEQAFVEKRCKELGIDYILIYTCNSAD